jgi:hypothetical protein
MDLIKSLESSINELEDLAKSLSQLKNPIFESSLDSFRFLFEKGENDKILYQQMESKDLKETLISLKTDLLPLFEEYEYESGLKQTQEWIKLLENHLEK